MTSDMLRKVFLAGAALAALSVAACTKPAANNTSDTTVVTSDNTAANVADTTAMNATNDASAMNAAAPAKK